MLTYASRLFGRFVVAAAALLAAAPASALPILFFGISTEYTVVAGTDVAVTGILRNDGDAALVFPAVITSGTPSEQGGALPSAGVSRGETEDAWEVIDLFSFAGFF